MLFVQSAFSQNGQNQTAIEAGKSNQSVIHPEKAVEPRNENQQPTPQSEQVFQKKPLPTDQKVSPAIFYVENDQPTDRLSYQRHVKQNTNTK